MESRSNGRKENGAAGRAEKKRSGERTRDACCEFGAIAEPKPCNAATATACSPHARRHAFRRVSARAYLLLPRIEAARRCVAGCCV